MKVIQCLLLQYKITEMIDVPHSVVFNHEFYRFSLVSRLLRCGVIDLRKESSQLKVIIIGGQDEGR